MPSKDRRLRMPSKQALAAAHERRKASGTFNTTWTDDPAVGAIRALLLFVKDADMQGQRQAGRPIDREPLLRLLKFLEEGGYQLGAITNVSGHTARIGTAEKGSLVQDAARALNTSPSRVRDLARQLADIAGELPEKMIGSS